mmetsp:Transcript_26177/g.75585  ORF Transcript_26177/g.75585 Transcript_26177/m.75585 type:complete len:213 (+) Transcript_26177:1139-1777(+)
MFLNKDDEQSHNGRDHTESKLNDLKECHKALPPGYLPCDRPLQKVSVHYNVHGGIPREADKVKTLFVFDPGPSHEQNSRVMINMKDEMRWWLASCQLQDGIEQLIVFAQVVNVAPVVERSTGWLSIGHLAKQKWWPQHPPLCLDATNALKDDAPKHEGAAADEIHIVNELNLLQVAIEPRLPLKIGGLLRSIAPPSTLGTRLGLLRRYQGLR